MIDVPTVQRWPHRVEWTLAPDDVRAALHCHAAEGAFCRLACSAGLCEEWPREGCAHGLTDVGYCNVVEFIENSDSVQSCYIGPSTSLRSGFIEEEWQGDYYGWKYADEVQVLRSMATRFAAAAEGGAA